MFTAWGHFAYQHRKVVPAVIVSVVLLCFLIFGTKLDERMSQEGWDDPHSSSTRAAQIEQEVFGRDNSGDIIMLFDAARRPERSQHSPDSQRFSGQDQDGTPRAGRPY